MSIESVVCFGSQSWGPGEAVRLQGSRSLLACVCRGEMVHVLEINSMERNRFFSYEEDVFRGVSFFSVLFSRWTFLQAVCCPGGWDLKGQIFPILVLACIFWGHTSQRDSHVFLCNSKKLGQVYTVNKFRFGVKTIFPDIWLIILWPIVKEFPVLL